MSVFIFLILLAHFIKPWLPLEWREKLFPREEAVERRLEPVSRYQGTLGTPEYATHADLQRLLTLLDSLKVGSSSVTSPSLTPEDLDLFEEQLAERFVTVERLDEMLSQVARVQRKAEKGSPPSQMTIVIPLSPTRPLPHPLPG
ncbi:MAG: hypothetical protein HY709_02120, partial [Candidatus Latescibacteria bacterium]|nr:hypothetical protein [Candidatus Latescibacterota bacterium]